MKPKFIVLEGIDGSGKSLVAKELRDYLELNGIKARVTAEPTKGIIGELVAKNDCFPPEVEALLFTADRALHTIEIKSWMNEGYTVISDRYVGSVLAYQSAAGVDIEWIKMMNSKVTIKPDFTFWLDINPEISFKRISTRNDKGDRFESFSYQKRVREAYLKLVKEYDYIKIDAARPLEEVIKKITFIISEGI
ncbi:MAG: dTMP kinase [archaeon]|nr:dTMP kinase [archaeon]